MGDGSPPWWKLGYPNRIGVSAKPYGVSFSVEVHVADRATSAFDRGLAEEFTGHRVEAHKIIWLYTGLDNPDAV